MPGSPTRAQPLLSTSQEGSAGALPAAAGDASASQLAPDRTGGPRTHDDPPAPPHLRGGTAAPAAPPGGKGGTAAADESSNTNSTSTSGLLSGLNAVLLRGRGGAAGQSGGSAPTLPDAAALSASGEAGGDAAPKDTDKRRLQQMLHLLQKPRDKRGDDRAFLSPQPPVSPSGGVGAQGILGGGSGGAGSSAAPGVKPEGVGQGLEQTPSGASSGGTQQQQQQHHHHSSLGDFLHTFLHKSQQNPQQGGESGQEVAEDQQQQQHAQPAAGVAQQEGGGVEGGDIEEGPSMVREMAEQLRGWQVSRGREEDFKAKVRAKQASLSNRTEVEIPVLSVLQYLVREIKKMRLYRTMPLYVAYLISLVIVSALTRFEGFDGMVYHHNLGVRQLLLADITTTHNGNDIFFDIDSPERYYEWLGKAVESVWDDLTPPAGSTLQDNNIPLGYLLVRQWRVTPAGDCGRGHSFKALSPRAKSMAGALCAPAYTSSGLSDESFGPGGAFTSNRNTPLPVAGVAVDGMLHSFDNLDAAFTVLIDYSLPKVTVQGMLLALQQNRFIDYQTRAISVGMITFNQAASTFVYCECCVEVTESGVWLQVVRSTAFSLFGLDTAVDYFVLVLDAMVLLFLLADVVFLAVSIKREQDLSLQGYFTLGNWNIFNFVLLLIAGYYYYYRVNMWIESLSITDDYYETTGGPAYGGDSDKAMLQLLSDYSVLSHRCFTFLSVLMIMSWLRLFSFVQYNERVTSFTDSVKLALTPLVSLGLIFLIVLFGFSLGGHILYGHDIDGFRDVLKTSGTLSRALVNGYVDEYPKMAQVHEFFSAVFFTSFFIFTWLLLLNMVLAVLVVTYSAIHEQRTEENRWDLMVLIGELKRWWLKIRSKHLSYLCEEGDPDYGREENYLTSRVQAVAALKEWFFSDETAPEYISKEMLRERIGGEAGFLCDASLEQVFRKAGRKQAVRSHAIRVGERWASQVVSRQRAMEGQLGKIQAQPLEKIENIARTVDALQQRVETNAESLSDVGKRVTTMSKDLKGLAAASQDTSLALRSQYTAQVSRLQSELHNLDAKNRRLRKKSPPRPSPFFQPFATSPMSNPVSNPMSVTPLDAMGGGAYGGVYATPSSAPLRGKSPKKKSRKKSSRKKGSSGKKRKKKKRSSSRKSRGRSDSTHSGVSALYAHTLLAQSVDLEGSVSLDRQLSGSLNVAPTSQYLVDPGLGWDDTPEVAPPQVGNPLAASDRVSL